MKKRMISPVIVLMMMFVGGVVLSGCNTIEGAGKDIEKAGQKIEDAAERHD
ncbi:entericidin A/B family lipoprotein [Marinobacterium mangrovicola]|uniref:Putative small secreted protein n=1 Tax=Marinobacterium mangrovicola TaxID=1476959 RepID=A0A4R1GJX6_9GAMM|nr:entericidin A/B family lipoprotein [Marinobacterium mangrovicola]TCK08697.1 putative small secreted protein [Marinobacterium mangrovicola]